MTSTSIRLLMIDRAIARERATVGVDIYININVDVDVDTRNVDPLTVETSTVRRSKR